MKYIILLLCTMTVSTALAQDVTRPAPAVANAGWVDRDGDGRHDLFSDADGDGINDANGQVYAHRFAWADADGDKLNDRYRDADGDGVNDLEVAFRDTDGDGRDENVLDLDGDNRNDITGVGYTRDNLHGDRFGFVSDGVSWVDEDGDGFADNPADHGRRGRSDRFIDSDGDGMADGCWFQDGGFQHHRARTGQGGGAGGGGGDGGPDFGHNGGWRCEPLGGSDQ
jgi:hypothetical protein